jgi:tetratricopeptide (TPR) repeat protein
VWHPAAGALLLHLVAKGAGTLSARPLTPAMRWIERRRRTLGLALVGGLALLLLAAVVAGTLERQDPHGPQVTLAGLAKNKYLLQDYPAAIRLYGQLLNEFPGGEMRGDYHYLRGNARFHQAEYAQAEADFREAIRLRPDYIQPRWNLIQVLHRQDRLGDALAVVAETEAKLGPKGDPGLKQRLADARAVLTGLVAQRAAEPSP